MADVALGNITSANATLVLTVDTVIPAGAVLTQFSTDQSFNQYQNRGHQPGGVQPKLQCADHAAPGYGGQPHHLRVHPCGNRAQHSQSVHMEQRRSEDFHGGGQRQESA